jgi:DNA polymerase-3 subunit beta
MHIPLLKLKQFVAYRKGIKGFDRHSTIPIMEDVLFRHVGGDAIELMVSNLETSITTRIAATNIPDGVAFAINAKQLDTMLKPMKGDIIQFDVVENGVKINKNTSATTHDADEYPRKPIIKPGAIRFDLTEQQLKNIVDYVAYTDDDELRPTMCGVCIRNKKDELQICATDGHRLIISRYAPLFDHEFDLVLSKDVANTIKAVGTTNGASFIVTPRQVIIIVNGVNIFGRPIEGKYPNCDAVIPKDNPVVAKINKAALIDIVKQCDAAAQPPFFIRLHFNGALNVSGENLDIGTSFASDIPYEKVAIEKDFTIGVNPKTLLSGIKYAPNELTLEMSTPSRPMMISSENQSIIIMPMMINN